MYSETSYYGRNLIVGLLVRKIFGKIESLYIGKIKFDELSTFNNHTYFNRVQIESIMRR